MTAAGPKLNPGELVLQEAFFYRAEGKRHQDAGDLRSAANAYRKAILVNTRYADAYNDLGVVLESLGDLQGAEQAYQSALALNPNLGPAHSNLALFYEGKGLLQQAAPHWSARVQMGPLGDPWAIKARQKLNQYRLSVPEAADLLSKKGQEEARVAYEKGREHFEAKQWESAAHEFGRALGLDPTMTKAAIGLKNARAEAEEEREERSKAIASTLAATKAKQPIAPPPPPAPPAPTKPAATAPAPKVPTAAAPAAPRISKPAPTGKPAPTEIGGVEEMKRQIAAGLKAAEEARQAQAARERRLFVEQVTKPAPTGKPAETGKPAPVQPKEAPPPPVRPSVEAGLPVEAAPPIVVPSEAQRVAQELAREKARTRKGSTRELLQRAVSAMRQGRFEEAVTHYNQVLTLEPNHAEAREGLKRAEKALKKSKAVQAR